MYCTECGKKHLESNNFCQYCGMRIKHHDFAGARAASEPLLVSPPVPHAPFAGHSYRESPALRAQGPSDSNCVARRLLVFGLVLMCVFPVIVLKRSADLYNAAGPTAPDASTLSMVDALAAARGNRDVASRWTTFDQSISRWATCTFVLDLAVAVCAAWIGFNLFTRKPLARAKQFMLAVALWALVRDLWLPRFFDLDVTGNKLSMILFLVASLAGFMYLKRMESTVREI